MFEPADRRRILAACITTLALAPLLLGDGGRGAARDVATIGQGDLAGALASSGSAGTEDAARAPADTPARTASAEAVAGGPGYLIGPPPYTEPDVIRIAVPQTTEGNAMQTTATFRRWDPNAVWVKKPCAVQGVADGTRVTVSSLENGQSISCTVVGQPRPGDRAPVVLDAPLFEQLADLIEAPIAVRVTW